MTSHLGRGQVRIANICDVVVENIASLGEMVPKPLGRGQVRIADICDVVVQDIASLGEMIPKPLNRIQVLFVAPLHALLDALAGAEEQRGGYSPPLHPREQLVERVRR